jgi:hypothetical protein
MKAKVLQLFAGLVLGVLGFGGVLVLLSGSKGLVDVPPSHVAVRIDYLTGSLSVVEGPGFILHLPYLQEVRLLDRRPQVFEMQGDEDKSARHVRYLTVRAKDGSNFWFDSMEIPYRIRSSAAADVLRDSGEAEAFQAWLPAYARAVLGDEFGRYAAQDVANATESQAAKVDALRRLNDYLAPHGVEVVQITTPKPKFDRDYEKAIYDRKIANQEVEKLGAQIDQLSQERGQRLAKVRKEKEIELAGLKGSLAESALKLEAQEIEVRGRADAYAKRRTLEGETRKAELLAQAASVRERGAREAEGLRELVAAVAQGGDAAVRAACVERLAGVRFRVSPARPAAGADKVAAAAGKEVQH